MKMLDTTNKLSAIEVHNEYETIRYHMDNSWLDLPLSAFSQKLREVFSDIRQYIKFEDTYYNIILEDECDTADETLDFVDLYVIELINVLVSEDDPKFDTERWASNSEVWNELNLTEMAKRKLLNYESQMKYFNITVLSKEGEVVYRLLND